jgi:UDP-N-acetylglucosamine--N-acetylmuramyl-(pentapeptide) pyrophosphoryl-undecaprenol N-acetylglucosamine transferase
LRVYFGVCGIGLGHAGRCIPIAEKLIEKGGEVLFSTYRDGVKYVEQAGFPVVKAPAVGFVVKADGTVDFRQTVVNPGPILASFTLTKQVEAEIKFMRAFKPDVVISDSRVSPLLAAKMLDIPDVCILNQFQIIIPRRSRLLRLAKLVDAGALAMIGKLWTSGAAHLMIPDFPPPYVLSAGNLKIPKAYQRRVKLIGPILPIHPDDLPSKEELRTSLGLDVDSKMVYLPISGPAKERAYITGLLRRLVLNLPENYQAVMSLGYPNTSMKPIHKGNVSIYGWVPNRFEYLKACDLVVSRAGHGTLTQSICYGKPMVLIPTPSHTEQVNNALRVKELGIAEVLEQKDVSADTLTEAIDRMLSDESCQKRVSEIQKDISGLNGLRTAVETVMQVAQSN